MILPVLGIKAFRTQLCLARDEVSYAGQTVALVVADSRYVAEDAAALVAVDYEVLPAISDCRDALKPGRARRCIPISPPISPSRIPMAYGDVDAAFAGAAHVIEEEFWVHRGGGMSLETRAVLASYEPAGDHAHRVVVDPDAASRPPRARRPARAQSRDHPHDRARRRRRVRAEGAVLRRGGRDPGGGARGSAVRSNGSRIGASTSCAPRRSATSTGRSRWRSTPTAKSSASAARMLHDTGAFVPWGIIMPYIAAVTVPGPYRVPTYRLDMTVVLTNKVATTPVRGAGRPQAVFVMERLMDRAARELEARPRRAAPAQPDPARRDALCGRPHVPRRQAAGLSRRRFSARPDDRARDVRLRRAFARARREARAQGRYIGIGIGNYVEGTGLGPFEGVTVRVLTNGKVAVATGATNQGQGQRTTLSQIVADEVGCRIEDVVMTMADTAAISQGVGAFASRQAINAGSSALISGQSVKKQIVALAALTLGVPRRRDRRRGRARDRAHRQQADAVVRRARQAGAGRAGRVVRGRADAGPRAHRLFHARRRPPIATAPMWSRSRSIR